mgnify:CR=1 FL=1
MRVTQLSDSGDGIADLVVISQDAEPNRDVFIGVAKLLQLDLDFLEAYLGASFLGLASETL